LKRSLIVLLLLVVALSAAAIAYMVSRASGMYLALRGVPSNATVFIYVEAVTPEGPRPLLVAAYEPADAAVALDAQQLHAVAKEWLEARPSNDIAGLVVHALVVDAARRVPLLYVVDAVSYPLLPVARGDTLLLELWVERLGERGILARIERVEARPLSVLDVLRLRRAHVVTTNVSMEPVGYNLSSAALPPPPGREPPFYRVCGYALLRPPHSWLPPMPAHVCWDPVFYLSPYRIAYLGLANSTVAEGMLYVDVPVLIVGNVLERSATLLATLGFDERLAKYRLYASIAVGPPFDGVGLPFSDKWVLWRGGATWGGEQYQYTCGDIVKPGMVLHCGIYARPFFGVYNVTVTFGSGAAGVTYNGLEMYAVITDVLVKKGDGVGEIVSTSWFGRSGSYLWARLIERYADLAFVRVLQPGEAMRINMASTVLQACREDIDLGIPLGVMARSAACASPQGGAAGRLLDALCGGTRLAKAAGSLTVGFHADAPVLAMIGILKNIGDRAGAGYNVPEYVYAARGLYRMKISDDCVSYPAVGFYIESR